MNKLGQSVIAALLFAGALALAGCGEDNTTTAASGTPGVFGPPVPPAPIVPPVPPLPPGATPVPTLVLTLTDAAGAATTSAPATVRAFVRDAAGVAIPSVVVTFTVDNATLAALVPLSGTALTDATGMATVGLNPANLNSAGAATLTATTQVPATTSSVGFSVTPPNVTITTPVFGGGLLVPANTLSAFGTTSVSVIVLSNGVPVTSPQTVSFSSPCAGSNKAVLDATVLTGAGGVATASYRDQGCGGTDTITASVSGVTPVSAVLTITPPVAGSIQFVSATPTTITLKGTGGAGRSEASQVIFKVVDTSGNGIPGQSVTFSLSTSVGGITLTNTTAISDANGQAFVTVNAGTISTPVRVLATTTVPTVPVTTLSTQSDQLSVTTGIPDQDSLSVSAVTLNIEGWDIDGITTGINARLADHFSNAVPDGTTVNFVAEGGQVCNPAITPCLGACNTTAGTCSVTMTSQAIRPLNGRVAVLVFAVGEESFTDTDGDGLADLANSVNGTSEMRDANGAPTDMGEAFLDNNENGIRDTVANSAGLLEEYRDFGGPAGVPNGAYEGPGGNPTDGKYNGVLCNETADPGSPTRISSPGTCSAQKSIHVFRNIPIVFSGSNPVFQVTDAARVPVASIDVSTPACTNAAPFSPPIQTVLVTVTDVNGNIMPRGTTVAFTTTNGTIVSAPPSFTVPNSTACLAGSSPGFLPGGALGGFTCPDPGDPTRRRCLANDPVAAAGFICPATSAVPFGSAPLSYAVTVKSDVTQTSTTDATTGITTLTCNPNTTSSGVLTATVGTPGGTVTSMQLSVID